MTFLEIMGRTEMKLVVSFAVLLFIVYATIHG